MAFWQCQHENEKRWHQVTKLESVISFDFSSGKVPYGTLHVDTVHCNFTPLKVLRLMQRENRLVASYLLV